MNLPAALGTNLAVALILVTALTGSALAQAEGLDRALDQQRQDLGAMREQLREQRDSQRRDLQQQQDQTLRFQLLQPTRPPQVCTRVGVGVVCQ